MTVTNVAEVSGVEMLRVVEADDTRVVGVSTPEWPGVNPGATLPVHSGAVQVLVPV